MNQNVLQCFISSSIPLNLNKNSQWAFYTLNTTQRRPPPTTTIAIWFLPKRNHSRGGMRKNPLGQEPQHHGLCFTISAHLSPGSSNSLHLVNNAPHPSSTSSEETTVQAVEPRFPLFQPLAELSRLVQGMGRAKLLWESILDGRDPWTDPLVTNQTKFILEQKFKRPPVVVHESYSSICGTRKLLLQLEDGNLIETVIIPDDQGDSAKRRRVVPRSLPEQKNQFQILDHDQVQDHIQNHNLQRFTFTQPRTTVCVSSQIGCNRKCDFCATGKMGLTRNLTADEILYQVYYTLVWIRRHNLPKLHNITFMGMGEALSNPENVHKALKILTNEFKFAQDRILLSSVGPSPASILSFVHVDKFPATLAWSVHAARDDLRRKLVPTTAPYTMAQLRDAYLTVMLERGKVSKKKKILMVEICLIHGINDGLNEARELADFLAPMLRNHVRLCVNLIPYNDIRHPVYKKPPHDVVLAFRQELRKAGYMSFIRTTRGEEQSAACGQLATTKQQRSLS